MAWSYQHRSFVEGPFSVNGRFDNSDTISMIIIKPHDSRNSNRTVLYSRWKSTIICLEQCTRFDWFPSFSCVGFSCFITNHSEHCPFLGLCEQPSLRQDHQEDYKLRQRRVFQDPGWNRGRIHLTHSGQRPRTHARDLPFHDEELCVFTGDDGFC